MVERTLDEAVLRSWIGRSEQSRDLIDAGQARRLQATLDRQSVLADGDPLPPLWHWIYFLSASPLSALGRDGHPRLGGFIPPVDLPRRMWAGGRFEFPGLLRLGDSATRTSTITDVALKHGRSGALCFVTVRHELANTEGRTCVVEEHDIVYREDPAPGSSAPAQREPPTGAQVSRVVQPSAVMLFRYSALTFNGHRIHYDRDYCRDVEGYPGLVFHGPLTATLLADLSCAGEPGRAIRRFSFRALSPLFDDAPFAIRAKAADGAAGDLELWAETPAGGLAMTAEAVF